MLDLGTRVKIVLEDGEVRWGCLPVCSKRASRQ